MDEELEGRKQYCILILGYGQNDNGSINDQTRARCEAAVGKRNAILALRHNAKVTFIITASAGKNGILMADEMRRYLIDWGFINPSDIILDLRGGNTAGEIDVALPHVRKHNGVLVPVSTWYHIIRIKWLCWMRGLGWVDCGIAKGHVRFYGDFLKEFAKMFNALIRPFRSAKVLPKPTAES